MNEAIKAAQEACTSANQDNIQQVYFREWRGLPDRYKKFFEKWFVDNRIASKVREAPVEKELYELVLTPEQELMNDEN